MKAKPVLPGRAVAISLLALCYALALFDRTAVQCVLPHLGAEFDLRTPGLALLSASLFWACVIGILFAGPLADIFGSRRVATAGILLIAAGGLVLAGADSYGALLGARVLVGVGCTLTFVAMLRFALAAFQGSRTASGPAVMLGNLGALTLLASSSLPFAGLDWRLVWIVLGFVATALAAMVWAIVPDFAAGDRPIQRAVPAGRRPFGMDRKPAGGGGMLACTLFAGGLAGGFYGFANAVAPGLLAVHGFSGQATQWALCALGAGHALGALAWGRAGTAKARGTGRSSLRRSGLWSAGWALRACRCSRQRYCWRCWPARDFSAAASC